jgi:hypothetical protein
MKNAAKLSRVLFQALVVLETSIALKSDCSHAFQPIGSAGIRDLRMHLVYAGLAFAEIVALFVSFGGLVFVLTRAIVRSFVTPKEPPPKPEDLRHLKRAGQSGFY